MPEVVNGDYLIERTGYDELGRVETHTDFRGYTSTMSYDVRGRMLSKVPDSRLNEKGLYMGYPDEFTTVASRGNGAGALVTTSISDAQRGWLRSVESPTGTLTYGYDVGGNRTSVTHTRGSESFTTNYAYDELSRLVEVSDGTTELAKIGYDLNGNRQQVLRANGVATGYQFDPLNRLDKLTHAKGNVVLSSFDYTVRQDGKRTGVTENIVNDQTAATPRTSSRDVGFTYDDAGRLTKEEGADGLGVSYENAWQYDAAGNRITTTYKRATVEAPNTVATTTTIAAVFTGNDWLKQQTSTVATAGTTNATTTFYGYDRNGAQTNERVGAAGAVEVNEWQFDGTLASTVTQGQATGGSEFVYDVGGNRLKQRTKIGTTDAKEVRYLVDPNTSYAQVVQERDEQNVLQARYAWEDGLAPLVMWRRAQNGAYAAFFYLCDGQDSVRQLTDASGRVTDSYFYDAFGNAIQGGSGDTPNTFRYTGQQLDASGDYYLRARYYNSGSGRFLSHDPAMGNGQDPISMHRYLYAANDGVNFVDPGGREFSLSGALTSLGVSSTLVSGGTAAINVATAISTAVSIYNIESSYSATGEMDWLDVAGVAVDLAGPIGKGARAGLKASAVAWEMAARSGRAFINVGSSGFSRYLKFGRAAGQASRAVGGLRRTGQEILSDIDIAFVTREFEAIGGDVSKLRFNVPGKSTSYSDAEDVIYISGNVFPDLAGSTSRDLMSVRAVLAHESVHMAHRGTGLIPGAWNDEFRASYLAAKRTVGLSEEDILHLLSDSLDRAKEGGVAIKMNDWMRRTLYGF